MKTPCSHRSGFTLIELLTVVAIMGVLLYLVTPVISSLLESNNLTFAGQTVADELAVARQYAASRNQTVYVRFIVPTGSAYQGYTALQIWRADPANPGNYVAVDHTTKLPTGIEISANSTLSPLVAVGNGSNDLAGSSTSAMPAGSSIAGNYVAFTVRPDGNVVAPNPPSQAATVTNAAFMSLPYYFLTLLPVRYDASATLPKNYVTIQINPDTANAQIFRP